MNSAEKALRFVLCLLPAAAIGGWFIAKYQSALLAPEVIESAAAQVGGMNTLIGITVLQTVLYAAVCGFFGYILSEKIGLMRPFRLESRPALQTLLITIPAAILFSLDPWVFGKFLPEIATVDEAELSPDSWMASILYGGIIEEIMMRLFFMSLIAWLLWKIFFRKQAAVPEGVIIGANFTAAILFAAGHLPFTLSLFGRLTPVILLRCFLLNGGAGLIFGRLYRKYGIQYAMLSHVLFHIISKTIWTLF
ncbi:MAG: CPBP family intramembrane metalloprotease [Flexilinea sp.]|nr:CPBP family intramembrane metalloprotease [Flexilinea sp.]